jgi:hypothetical protein
MLRGKSQLGVCQHDRLGSLGIDYEDDDNCDAV